MSRNILLNKRSFKPIHAVKQLKQIKGQYKAIVDYWVDDGYPEELKNILKIKP